MSPETVIALLGGLAVAVLYVVALVIESRSGLFGYWRHEEPEPETLRSAQDGAATASARALYARERAVTGAETVTEPRIEVTVDLSGLEGK